VNFTEHAGKAVLAAAGIPVPHGIVADTPEQAADAAGRIGRCVIKAQVPAGKRGKAGGIRLAATPEEARAGGEICGSRRRLSGGAGSGRPQVAIAEVYAAVLNVRRQGPLLQPRSRAPGHRAGGDAAESLVRIPVDVRKGHRRGHDRGRARRGGGRRPVDAVAALLARLYAAYAASDAGSSRSIRWC
jgi:succinyl-CoA synthetase beta subunit